MRSVPSERKITNAFAMGLKPMHTSGRNTCQIARLLEDASRIIWTQHVRNSPGLSQVLFLAGRCSDHKQGISPFPRSLAAIFCPSALAAFPSREDGDSVLETAGVWPEELCGQSRQYAASGNTLP